MTDRKTDYPILPIFPERWSPRAFDPRPMDDATLFAMFEAARWAPSSINLQPWRFIYAKRDDAHWESFLSGLWEANQSWAKNASALVYVVSDTKMEMRGTVMVSPTHSFDAGAAWMAMALQGTSMGVITHGMAGVDFDRAREILQVPEQFAINAAIAVGYPGDKASLPEPLREREAPNSRRPVSESISNGPMGG